MRGTINGSLGAEFEKFQRTLVDKFLGWQADIVNEYRREDQFVTHNLDFEWRGYSYGIQPYVNHLHASQCLTIAGTDIYPVSYTHLNVIVLGHVQDENGQKMSKSKGNAVDPFDALETYGADAIRWYFYINSAPCLLYTSRCV